MREQNVTQFFYGLLSGFIAGFIIGYIIARRSKKPEGKVTEVNILAFLIFLIYVSINIYTNHEPSWIIAIGILATGYGAKGGEILEKILEKK